MFKKERLEKNPDGQYKIFKVKCYGELHSVIRILRLREGWRDHKKQFWNAFLRGYRTDNFELEDASDGSQALFGVLKVMDEVTTPLHKTVLMVYTEGDPTNEDPHDLLDDAVRIKTTSVLLQAPEADPEWQGAKQTSNAGVVVVSDPDEDDDII